MEVGLGVDSRLGLVFAGPQTIDLGLSGGDQQIELTDLGLDLLLLGGQIRARVHADAQFPISGPLIQPCLMA